MWVECICKAQMLLCKHRKVRGVVDRGEREALQAEAFNPIDSVDLPVALILALCSILRICVLECSFLFLLNCQPLSLYALIPCCSCCFLSWNVVCICVLSSFRDELKMNVNQHTPVATPYGQPHPGYGQPNFSSLDGGYPAAYAPYNGPASAYQPGAPPQGKLTISGVFELWGSSVGPPPAARP